MTTGSIIFVLRTKEDNPLLRIGNTWVAVQYATQSMNVGPIESNKC